MLTFSQLAGVGGDIPIPKLSDSETSAIARTLFSPRQGGQDGVGWRGWGLYNYTSHSQQVLLYTDFQFFFNVYLFLRDGGARTHKPRDHDLSRRQTLDRLSHPSSIVHGFLFPRRKKHDVHYFPPCGPCSSYTGSITAVPVTEHFYHSPYVPALHIPGISH